MARNLKNEISALRELITGKKFHARVFATIHVLMEDRIFKKGLDSNGQRIGRYSKGYKATRKRKGYPSSNKVILQAENEMRSDFRFGVDSTNNYASGFVNPMDFKKSHFVEKTYKKDIFSLSEKESQKTDEILTKNLSQFLG